MTVRVESELLVKRQRFVTASRSKKACGLEVHEAAEARERQIRGDRLGRARSGPCIYSPFRCVEET
jgi:hypothetical protein